MCLHPGDMVHPHVSLPCRRRVSCWKRGAELDSALVWGAEARQASAHGAAVLDLSGTDATTNAIGTAVARVREPAALLDRAGILYQFELDDDGDIDGAALVLRHLCFPEGRYPS